MNRETYVPVSATGPLDHQTLVYTATAGIISQTTIDSAIRQARAVAYVLVLDVLVPVDEFAANKQLLESNHFTIGGTVSHGTPETKIYIRFRKSIRSSGDWTARNSVHFDARPDYEQRVITECLEKFRK